MNLKNVLLATAGVLITIAQTQAQTLPLDPAVRTGKLPNGFTYYIRHNEEPKDRVVFYLANKVGSILENEEQRGLAHFLEHMSFNGTTHFPKNELVDYLQKSGVRFGADLNAYTSFDETVYQLPLPTDKPDILKNGIQIMRDWANGATLDPNEINKERGVVLEEKRLGKGKEERLRMQYWPTLLNNSRYAERVPIGLEPVIQNFKPETIRSFYNDWYRPDLQALIVVGDIDVDQMEKTIKDKFGDLKNPPDEKVRTKYEVQLTGKNQFIAVTDRETESTSAEVIIKHKAPLYSTEADFKAAIITSLFNQMLGERYAELSRMPNPPYLQGGGGISGMLGGLDNFTVSVVAKNNSLEAGLKTIWRETARVKRFGFTTTEIDRAKQSYMSGMDAAMKERSKIRSDSYVKEYLNNFLKGEATPGIDLNFKIVQKTLLLITSDDLNKVAREYIRNDNRDIILMAPDKDKETLPSEVTVVAWLKEVEAEELKPYQDAVSTKPLLTRAPASGQIISEEKNAALNITTLTLSNGVKVVLKPTDYKNNQILFNAFSAGGTSLYADADFQSANNACGVISSFGAGNYNAIELGKYLSGKQFAVQPFIAERNQGLSGTSTPKDLESAFQLIYAYLTEPRKDQEQFDNIIQRSRAILANRGNDPATVYSDSVSAILGSYNLRRTGPTVSKLMQVNLDRAFAIYKERFADASGMTFTMVGNIDMAMIKPLLEKYIAALPSTNSHEHAKDLGILPPAGIIERNIYKGTEPKATVQLFYTGDFTYNNQEKKQLEALKEVLQIRLLERLREDESGVYTPSASTGFSKQPHPRYSFAISFGCAPQNVEKLVASALDEVNKLRTAGPPQVNIDKYKAEDERSHETAVKSNGWWLGYLSMQLQDGAPLDQLNSYEATLQKITPERLKKTAQKYLSGKNYIRLVLLPEKV